MQFFVFVFALFALAFSFPFSDWEFLKAKWLKKKKRLMLHKLVHQPTDAQKLAVFL